MRCSFGSHRKPIRRGLMALAIACAACGGDTTGPVNADLAGEWDYVISDATGAAVSFTTRVTDIALTFTGSGNTLAGTVSAGGDDNIALEGDDGTTFRTVSGSSSIRNLAVNGASIAFEFWDLSSAALSSQHPIASTGNIARDGNSMSGTVTLTLRFSTSGGVATRPITGTWTATRR